MAKTISNSELDSIISYMTISFDYSWNIVLPYKDGIALLATLEKAESIDRYYSGGKLKFNGKANDLTMCTVTQKEYREQKMEALLLGVDDDDTTNSN